jgi:hypothetical protein
MFLQWAAFMYTGRSRLDPATMELCRLRMAARNHCVHLSLSRFLSGMMRL